MRLEVVGYWRWYRGDIRPREFSPFDYGHTVPKCNCFCQLQMLGFPFILFKSEYVCGMHACMHVYKGVFSWSVVCMDIRIYRCV